MLELEQGHLLPGQQVRVQASLDGRCCLDVDGVAVQVDRDVADEVYVSV